MSKSKDGNGIILLTRQGECNNCGECCGRNADNPWPKNHLDMHMDWQFSEWAKVFPQVLILGLTADAAGKTKVARKRSISVVGDRKFPYVWHDGQPCQNLTPEKRIPTPSTRCPFLFDAEDGVYLCGLVGTEHEIGYQTACSGEVGLSNGIPPYKYSQEDVDQWMTDFPDCSYTWK